MTSTSCFRDATKAELSAEYSVARLDLTTEDRYAIGRVALDILQRFEPEDYIYVFLGQSPTPFHAFFVSVQSRFEDLTFTSIPHSSVRMSKPKIELEGFIGPGFLDRRDFFQKMISHFDRYLGDVLLKELERAKPRRIVIIDYKQSGHCLGEANRQVDFYLYHLSIVDKTKAGFRRLKTEYLALADHVSGLKEQIDEHKQLYKSNISGLKPVEVEGPKGSLSSKLIDIDERVKRLNESLADSWHWDGDVIDINSYSRLPDGRGNDLLLLIRRQAFDPFSLHGSWYLSNGSVEASVPINPLFFDLVEYFSVGCSPADISND